MLTICGLLLGIIMLLTGMGYVVHSQPACIFWIDL